MYILLSHMYIYTYVSHTHISRICIFYYQTGFTGNIVAAILRDSKQDFINAWKKVEATVFAIDLMCTGGSNSTLIHV